MSEDFYYHSYHNRDRLLHIVDDDIGTCEALSVLFRLEGFQTAFFLTWLTFLQRLNRGGPTWWFSISL